MSPQRSAGASPEVATESPWLPWLVRLRWVGVAGQLAVVGVARWAFAVEVPMRALLSIVAITAASNVLLGRLSERARDHTAPLATVAIALDVVLLTTLLGLTGGPANPFSVLYLVHVALAALVLGMRASIAIAALCVVSYATLFAWHVPVAWDHGEHAHHAGSRVGLHLQGMWVATALASAAIGYFVARVAGALRERDAQVRRLEQAASRDEKLIALSALAAGAAHELASPLATIAVAARELERAAEGLAGAGRLRDDARLIREQTVRCREILNRVSGEAGVDPGEELANVPIGLLLEAVRDALEPHERARLRVLCADGAIPVRTPRGALARALTNLVRNGLAAVGGTGGVSLRATTLGDAVRFEVRDEGAGMSADVLARAGEPFFTTRPPGEGMGLGLFLARALAERLGGRLWLESAPEQGTTAFLEVLLDPLPHGVS
jgi:two-component system sensor histidine kinase RegB